VQVTDANGCSNTSASSIVTINPFPVLDSIAGPSSLCMLGTTAFVHAVPGGVWASNTTSVASVDVNGLVTGVGAGSTNISYTVTNNSCATTVMKDIIVTGLSTITAQPIAAVTQCIGTSVGITVAATGTGVSYQWYQDGIAITGAISNAYGQGVLTATDAGNYTVVVTGSCNNVTSDASVWIVNALPTVAAITGIQQVCVGSVTSFSSTTSGGVWSSSNIAIATVTVGGVISGVAAGTATIIYTVTNSNGCVTTVTRTVTVNALPTVLAITGNTGVCAGSTMQLANGTTGGVWSTTANTFATINNTGLVTGVSAGTATVNYTVTNSSGCVTVVNTTVTVNALPTVTASSSLTTISKGLTVQLLATTTGTIVSYSWTPAANLNNAAIANPVARVTDNTVYGVTVTSSAGCVATATISVTAIEDLYVQPTNVFTPNGDGINDRFVIKNLDQYPNIICAGGCITDRVIIIEPLVRCHSSCCRKAYSCSLTNTCIRRDGNNG